MNLRRIAIPVVLLGLAPLAPSRSLPARPALPARLALPSSAAPAGAEAPEAGLRPVAVAAFKSGLGFVVRQGDAALVSGQGRIEPIPSATLGSLWLAPNDPGATLDELIAYRYTVERARSVTSLADILLLNPGKTVTIEYNNQKEYTGEIVGLRQPEAEGGENPAVAPVISPVIPAPAEPQILLLRVEGKTIALPLQSVTQIVLPPEPILERKYTEESRALRFRIKGAGAHANLTMGYLEKGLGWTPSYLISIHDDDRKAPEEKTAEISMQAILVNDAEDLKNAEAFFVVGVPNFAYSDMASPMALQQTLVELMKDAEERDNRRRQSLYSNALAGQMVVSGGAAMAVTDAVSAPDLRSAVEELTGAPEEDLFLYTRSGVTLARGERATYNVFSGGISYEHLYEWDVPDTSRVNAFGNVEASYNTPEAARGAMNSVWHSLRLKNSTKFPWTSAPAIVISGTKPVAQDTLPYTPRGATSNLRLTVATDLRASHEEREIARQENAPHRAGYRYDLVTVEGTLEVKNYKSKDVPLEIRKQLRGAVLSASDGAKSEKLGEAIEADNPNSRLTWNLTLRAGEEKKVTYQYKIWVLR